MIIIDDNAFATFEDLKETGIETNEDEYRRGYCDGFIQAVNAMEDNKFLRTHLSQWMFDFWADDLHAWLTEHKGEFYLPPQAYPRCVYCGGVATQLDHVHPKSKGGSNDYDNLVYSCQKCNYEKRDKHPDQWINRWYEKKTIKTFVIINTAKGQPLVGK